MRKKFMRIKDVTETILAVVFPSLMMGLLIAFGLYAAMGWELVEETYSRFNTVVLVSSMAFAIYFSIKATIYVMEEKQKKMEKKLKRAEIIPFGKNPKLYESNTRIS